MTMEFTVVAEGRVFPEGPIAMPDGSVIFVELGAGVITRAWGDGKLETVASPGGGPNGAAIGPDGALYVCNAGGLDLVNFCNATGPGTEGRIERIDLSTGKVERMFDRLGDRLLRAPNDIVFDADGGFYFTDLGKDVLGTRDPSALYYARADGTGLTSLHDGALSYNGVGLSPDQQTLYAADTRSARLYAFDLVGPGQVKPPAEGAHSPARYVGSGVGDVWFDSLAVTAAGNICVGTLTHGGITTFTPSGETSFQPFPDAWVTNLCFGGDDMTTAFLTFGGAGQVVRATWPEPGLALNFCPYR
jgi:gluconolactonase